MLSIIEFDEVHLTQEEEMRWDLERQLERETRSRGSFNLRLEQAQESKGMVVESHSFCRQDVVQEKGCFGFLP